MDAMNALTAEAVQSFAVFAAHSNFTRAAAELHISQPSLHVKIKNLSTTLGLTLYERDGRSLVLTDAGRRLAAFAADAKRSSEDFLAESDNPQGGARIATGRGALRWVISDALRAMGEQQVRLIIGGRQAVLDATLAGIADVAVLAFDKPPAELESVEIGNYPQVLVIPAGHTLADRGQLTLSDLEGTRLVLPPPGRPHRQSLERALLDAGIAFTVAAEVDGWDALVHLTELGLGAAIVNGCVVPPEGLISIPITDLPTITYWAAWRSQRQKIAAAFVHQITDA